MMFVKEKLFLYTHDLVDELNALKCGVDIDGQCVTILFINKYKLWFHNTETKSSRRIGPAQGYFGSIQQMFLEARGFVQCLLSLNQVYLSSLQFLKCILFVS